MLTASVGPTYASLNIALHKVLELIHQIASQAKTLVYLNARRTVLRKGCVARKIK